MSATDVTRPEPLGRPIRGPSAVGGDWRRLLHLTRLLAVTDFKLRFFGSVLGYLWQVMHPLLLFGVLYVVFTEVVPLGEDVVLLPRRAAVRAGAVRVPLRVDQPVGPEPRGARADRPQDPVSAARRPALDRAHRPVPDGAEHAGRLRLPVRLGRTGHAVLARAAADPRAPDRACGRAGGAPVGAVRALPRRQADLGRAAPGDLLRLADLLSDHDRHERRRCAPS